MGQLASCWAKPQYGTITLGKNGKLVAISTETVSNFMRAKNQGWKIEKFGFCHLPEKSHSIIHHQIWIFYHIFHVLLASTFEMGKFSALHG